MQPFSTLLKDIPFFVKTLKNFCMANTTVATPVFFDEVFQKLILRKEYGVIIGLKKFALAAAAALAHENRF